MCWGASSSRERERARVVLFWFHIPQGSGRCQTRLLALSSEQGTHKTLLSLSTYTHCFYCSTVWMLLHVSMPRPYYLFLVDEGWRGGKFSAHSRIHKSELASSLDIWCRVGCYQQCFVVKLFWLCIWPSLVSWWARKSVNILGSHISMNLINGLKKVQTHCELAELMLVEWIERFRIFMMEQVDCEKNVSLPAQCSLKLKFRA